MTGLRRARIAGVIWLLLFTLLLWLSSLVSLRLPHQNDTLVHLRWADQFLSALREGWLLPRWAYASIGGLGDPTFLYYQPLFYYITSTFSLLGLRSEYALLCAAMLPFLLLGGVVYLCLLGRYQNRHALVGASYLIACPVLYFVTTHVGAFPWALSLPFSVLFVAESTRLQPRPAHLAFFLGLVCLSHLLSGLMAMACVGLARLVFARPDRTVIRGHLQWALGVVLGLGLAGFFIYPAMTQLHLIHPAGWVDGANFDWRRAFALPTFTFAQYGFRWFAIQVPYALIALVLCLFVLLPLAGADDTPGKVFSRRLAWVAAAALVFGSELAYPLYAVLTPLQKLQFPYRFVFLALLLANIAFVVQLNEGAWARWRFPVRVVALGLVVAQAAVMGHLQWNLYKYGKHLPARSAFMVGRFGQPEYVPAVRGTNWKPYLAAGKLAGECKRLNIDCRDTVHRTHDFSTRILASTRVTVRLPIFAFPAWSVSVNGKPVGLVADGATGLIRLELLPGEHRIKVAWSTMRAEVIGWSITGASTVFMAGGLLAKRWRRRKARAGAKRIAGDRAPIREAQETGVIGSEVAGK